MTYRRWTLTLVLVLCAASTASAFTICGKATERPGVNAPLARFAVFTLQPTGISTLSSSSGIFCFDDVAAGELRI